MVWLDIIAIIISVVAFLLSVYQFLVERKLNRMAATIDALVELQKDVLNNEEFINAQVDHVLEHHKTVNGEFDVAWETISEHLARIEQFAVGVNTKVYSIEILDRMAGSHIIKLFNKFEPIIIYKREKGKTNKRYIEFETMVNCLKKYNPNLNPSR